MRTLDDVNLADYDFLDFGAGTGASLRRCAEEFGGRGLGIDIHPVKIDQAQADGVEVVKGDILTLPRQKLVRYVCMDNFLEHLPDYDTARQMIEVAVKVAREFVFIAHPSFEDEAYLRAIGLKQYWQDWTGHPSHLLLSDLLGMLSAAGAGPVSINYLAPAHDSADSSILPVDAPRDQHHYDAAIHGPKSTITFSKPIHRQIHIIARVGADPKVAELQRRIDHLQNRRAIRLSSAVWRIGAAPTMRKKLAAARAAADALRHR